MQRVMKRFWWIPTTILGGLSLLVLFGPGLLIRLSEVESQSLVEAARRCSASRSDDGTPRARLERLATSCADLFRKEPCRAAVRAAADAPPTLVFRRLLEACQPAYCPALGALGGPACAPPNSAELEEQWFMLSTLAHAFDLGPAWETARGEVGDAIRALCTGLSSYEHPTDIELRATATTGPTQLEVRDQEGHRLLDCTLPDWEQETFDGCLNQLGPKRFADASVRFSANSQTKFGFVKALMANVRRRGARDLEFRPLFQVGRTPK